MAAERLLRRPPPPPFFRMDMQVQTLGTIREGSGIGSVALGCCLAPLHPPLPAAPPIAGTWVEGMVSYQPRHRFSAGHQTSPIQNTWPTMMSFGTAHSATEGGPCEDSDPTHPKETPPKATRQQAPAYHGTSTRRHKRPLGSPFGASPAVRKCRRASPSS